LHIKVAIRYIDNAKIHEKHDIVKSEKMHLLFINVIYWFNVGFC